MALPVKLQAVVDVMEAQSDEVTAYINRKTGEPAAVSDEEISYAERDDDDDFVPEWQKELVEQAKGLAITSKSTSDTNERSTLAVQFNSLLTQIDTLAADASYGGSNLIQATPDNLTVSFNESGTSTLTVSPVLV